MNLLDEQSFEKECGKMMPLRRNMSVFDGTSFQCACGSTHTFNSFNINVVTEGFNGKFVVMCPSNQQYLSLIKTKMKYLVSFQGFEYIAGHKIEDND